MSALIVGENVEIVSTGEVVSNVLIAPGTQNDRPAADSADSVGATPAYTLHFPREFEGDLQGERLVVRGEVFRVIGCPKPYTLENNATPWNMPVEVAALHYDVPFTLEQCTPTINERGDSINEWNVIYEGDCRIKQISSAEEQIGAKTQTSVVYEIYCDWDDCFINARTKNTRLIINDMVFDITQMNNLYELCDVVKIKAVCRE